MKYHFRPDELKQGVGSGESGLQFLSCQRIELDEEHPVTIVETGPEEVVLACISGQFDYDCGETVGTASFKDVLYVPWRSRVSVRLGRTSDVLIRAVLMRIGAPSDRNTGFAHLRFSDVALDPARHRVYGKAEDNSLRDVYMIIDDTFNAARLLVGIGQGSTGGWTVWPPHEHGDEKEELYVYFDMVGGFGIQCVYETLDEARCFLVREGDMVAVPRGFHPNVGCPAGRISYAYAMAARVAGEREFLALRFQEEFGDRF